MANEKTTSAYAKAGVNIDNKMTALNSIKAMDCHCAWFCIDR